MSDKHLGCYTLGIRSCPLCIHAAWCLKTPIHATVPLVMAYRFVHPTLFMPSWGQRVMVPGHTPMIRVVTGRLQQRNNDVDISRIHPF
jgi:hypothetical protein